MYNLLVEGAKSPEFDSKRPVASAMAVLRAIFFAPRSFYLNFTAEGPLREPALFVLLVSAVSGVLSTVVNLISSTIFETGVSLSGLAVSKLVFVVLSPILVGAVAGVYLLAVRTFIGTEGKFREVYRMLAYAYGAAILLWIPGVSALAFTYATFILMLLGIRSVYRTSLQTALITALTGFVPVALAFIGVLIVVNGLVAR
jgi:hypothetical protein